MLQGLAKTVQERDVPRERSSLNRVKKSMAFFRAVFLSRPFFADVRHFEIPTSTGRSSTTEEFVLYSHVNVQPYCNL